MEKSERSTRRRPESRIPLIIPSPVTIPAYPLHKRDGKGRVARVQASNLENVGSVLLHAASAEWEGEGEGEAGTGDFLEAEEEEGDTWAS